MLSLLKRLWRPRPAAQCSALRWQAYLYRHPFTGEPLDTDYPNTVFHIARSPVGSFEICDMDGEFLLLFPRSMTLPAELFHDLEEAKTRALSSLKDHSP